MKKLKNTKKEIPVISKSQFRRIEAQGGNPVLVRPCKNCGQTRGERVDLSVIGNLHDHICAECGREMPIPDKLPNKLQQFLFVDIDDTYTLRYDGYREKNHWTLIRKGHITENGGRVFDGDFYDVVAYLTGFEKEEILDGR